MVSVPIVIQKPTKGKPALVVTTRLLSAIHAGGSLVLALADKGETE